MEYLLLIIPVVFIVVIILRTLKFKPNDFPRMKKEHDIHPMHAVESLSQMIQFKTVSNVDPFKIDHEEFKKFQDFLVARYPEIHKKATLTHFELGLLYHLKGESSEQPIVFMAHYDVVPINGEWKEDPFSGRIDEHTVYGRGALDTKSSLNAIMESFEHALKIGKTFKHDVYLAFGGDEETYGSSQKTIVEHFKHQGIKPYFVLDEGGAIVANVFPGVKDKAAVVGIAEKGFMNVILTAKSAGGHASTPPTNTTLTLLSKAVTRLNNHPSFKLKLTPPVEALFDRIAPHSQSFGIRMLFANLWIFLPLVKFIAKKSGGEFLSLFKTTQAFTMASGSEAINVLPAKSTIGINYRLRPFETSDDVIKRIKKIIKNDDISVEAVEVSEASTISKIDDRYKIIEQAIQETWPKVIPTPYLMIATSDSRHYHEICDHVYKFSPMDVTKDDLRKIHGVDEDISIENIKNGVYFYLNLIDQL